MIEYAEVDFLEIEERQEYVDLIQLVIRQAFLEESIENMNLYINIILTNSQNIKKMNKEYRNIDKETDVLSFPMFEKSELEDKRKQKNPVRDVLGDVVISIPKVKQQAEEYGHSFERELAYMLVHGFYHLMGYDHMEEEEKTVMRSKEENVLQKLDIIR